GGDPARPNVETFRGLDAATIGRLRTQGYVGVHAPAVLDFYQHGAGQLLSAVTATVLASTVVVGFVSAAFVAFELRARRKSWATLGYFAGRRLPTRLAWARSIWVLAVGHAAGAFGGALVAAVVAHRWDLALTGRFLGVLATTFVGGLLGAAVAIPRKLAR